MNSTYFALIHPLEVQILRHGCLFIKVLHLIWILLVSITILEWLLLRHLLLTLIRRVLLLWLLLMELLCLTIINCFVLVLILIMLLHYLLVHWLETRTLMLLWLLICLGLLLFTVQWSSLGSLILESLCPRRLGIVLLAMREGCVTILSHRGISIVWWEFLRWVTPRRAISSLILNQCMWLLLNFSVFEITIGSRILIP